MSKFRIPSDYKNDTPLANHNWNTSVGGTFHPGLAIPIKWRHMDAKSRYRGKPNLLVQSQPMRGPLLNGFKQTVIATFLPDSVIYGWMRSGRRYSPAEYMKFNEWNWNPSEVYLVNPLAKGLNPSGGSITPQELFRRMQVQDEFAGGRQYYSVGRGGLCDWMGVSPGTVAPNTTGGSAAMNWTIAPYIHYFLSVYYYFANMQEQDMYYTRSLPDIMSRYNSAVDVPFSGVFQSVDPNLMLSGISELFYKSMDGTADSIGDTTSFLPAFNEFLSSGLGNGGGLFAVPYSPDLFTNIIKLGESPTAKVPVVIPEGASPDQPAVYVPELRFQTKLQNALDRLFVSGGRWSDVLRTLFGSSGRGVDINKPEFLGVWQTSINPSNVVAQSPGTSSDGNVVDLGQMGARIDRYSDFGRSQGIDYYTEEPGTLMFISVLLPEPSYCQGIVPDHVAGSFADRFNPDMNGLGFQSVPRWRFSTLPNNLMPDGPYNGSHSTDLDPNAVAVGDEVAWAPLKTDYPTLHGEFAQFGYYQYWTLNRRFTEYNLRKDASVIGDLSILEYYGTYVNPLSWQYLFDAVSFEYQNFILLAQFEATVTSSVSTGYMPYLGR